MGCRLWWRRAHRQPPAMMGGIAPNPDMYIGCIHVMDSSAGLLVCQNTCKKQCVICYARVSEHMSPNSIDHVSGVVQSTPPHVFHVCPSYTHVSVAVL